ncbi:MAG: methylisocitrate lyase [Thermoplasmata archaeon]|jgi:methylisocitrate lyase|nr:methylisocitrate lyase [Thermoplasmatales archaeon]
MSILRDNVNLGPGELRNLISKGITAAPGVFNGITAIMAERAGFRALYLSGSGIAGAMGLPDLSLTTLTEVAEEVRRITSVTRLPLIVDVDTGFGEALNVIRTVRLMESSGASAVHIEDQELPKKCGHLPGKRLVSEAEMVKKIIAAVESRKNKDFIIIARTDARAVEGIEGAIRRAGIYVDAGADMIFPEALESEDEFRIFAREVRAPLLANMTEFGKSPLLSVSELEKLGYRLVIFPLTAFRASLLAAENAYLELSRKGTQREFLNNLMTRKKFYEIIGYEDYEKDDMEISEKGSRII